LEYLGEVKISGFTGAHEEIDLVRLLFESSKSIKSMTLNATKDMTCAVSLLKLMGEEDGIDTIDQELQKIPYTDRGHWQLEEDVYTWTRHGATQRPTAFNFTICNLLIPLGIALLFEAKALQIKKSNTHTSTRPPRPMGGTGDVDGISALPDDLLHLILGFLPDATAAARMAVLSRRWRHVWVHAQNLVLSDIAPTVGNAGCRAKPGYFAGFVDRLFARRGDVGIGSLQIRLYNHHCTSPEKVNAWTRYAVQHVVDSFLLRITQKPTTTIIELPSHGRTTSIQLNLSGNSLQLPTVAASSTYEALTELVLDSARLGGGGRALGDFVSSCCPRLRKLDIRSPMGLPELVLRVDALEELHLSHAEDLRTLDVTAPNLRVFWVHRCFHGGPRYANKVARVVAPRLEVIGMRDHLRLCKRPDLEIHGLTSVRRLSDLHLDMRGRCYRNTSAGIWLLENCPGVEHVQVSLDHYCGSLIPPDEGLGLPVLLALDRRSAHRPSSGRRGAIGQCDKLRGGYDFVSRKSPCGKYIIAALEAPSLDIIEHQLQTPGEFNWLKTCTIYYSV
ncbi:hypothetical protein BAE44_0011715, partial [Dichanthelium oligosanthes]